MSFFLIAFFIAFVLSFGRVGGRRGKGGEEKEEVEATEVNRQKKRGEMTA